MRRRGAFDGALELLGGPNLVGGAPQEPIDVHLLLTKGLPVACLVYLLDRMSEIARSDLLEPVIAVSPSTLRRRRKVGGQLTIGQSVSLWRIAVILARAIEVFGTQAEAERWLCAAALGLDRHRPIDLLTTEIGAELVVQQLGRIGHGVYT